MKRVLVIDDSGFMRKFIKRMLEKNGFEVVGEAENGIIGIGKYNELFPDIVTLDLTMQEMDGLQTLKEIKAINSDANVIMISAMGQEVMIRDAILAGAKGFIVKPFKEETLINAFKKF